MKPLVSIIIPCYNAEAYIRQALNSVLDQNVEDLEIIVINDGSTDESTKILESYANRIIVKNTNNKGAAYARNVGLVESKGRYVKYLDADDYLLDGMLKRQLELVQHLCPDESQVPFGGYRTDNLSSSENSKYIRHAFKFGDEVTLDWLIRNQILITTPLHRRKLLIDIGGFNESLKRGQEYDLHLRMALKGVTFVYHDDIVFHYRDHSGVDRISNTNVIQYAKYFHQILYNLISELKTRDSAGNTDALLAAAQISWKIGRSLIQRGGYVQAKQFFNISKSVGVNDYIYGGYVYKFLVSIVGTYIAEKIGKMRSRVFTIKF